MERHYDPFRCYCCLFPLILTYQQLEMLIFFNILQFGYNIITYSGWRQLLSIYKVLVFISNKKLKISLNMRYGHQQTAPVSMKIGRKLDLFVVNIFNGHLMVLEQKTACREQLQIGCDKTSF